MTKWDAFNTFLNEMCGRMDCLFQYEMIKMQWPHYGFEISVKIQISLT